MIFGSKSSWSSPISLLSLNGNNGFTINGINSGGQSGYSVASAGDVNGDGIDDLIVGAPRVSSDAGQSYVIFGSKSSWSSPFSLSSLNGNNGFILNGINLATRAAFPLPVRATSMEMASTILSWELACSSNATGQSYVVFGSKNSWSSPISLSSLNGNNGFILNGTLGSLSGFSVATAGDVNGDGIGDLIVGGEHALLAPQVKAM